jgi:transcriptional regulator with XRE-family HTH domain
MPAQLNDEVTKLAQAFANVKQRLDKDSVKALGKQALSLRQLLKEMLSTLDVFKNDNDLSDTGLKVWEQSDSGPKIERLKKVGEKITIEESTELSTFFTNISNAVIDAQRNLNSLSQTYISQLEKDKSPVPPTYFAIPSLKAEMKLGVSEITSKGVNVILFKSEQQQQRFFESAVTFELVSTPPAPATRPKELTTEGVPQLEGVSPVLEAAPRGLELESVTSEDEEERSRIDELTLELEEAKAAMIAVTDTLIEEKGKPKRAAAKKPAAKTKKAAAKKARTTKTKKSKR